MEEFRHERRENPFALIVVLFILLIIVGASFMMGGY
ncbi:YjcZ family sporulation protein [Neobacillus sp. NPDC093127]